MRYRRIFTIIVAIAFVVSMGVGAVAQGDVTELTWWVFVQMHAEVHQKSIDRWNAEHPDRQVHVNFEVYSSSDVNTKLLVALQSGTGAPDITDQEISYFGNFLQGDIQLVPLTDEIEKAKDSLLMNRYEIYAVDGEYYGAEIAACASIAYWNAELLNAAGIDINAIETWDDFAQAGRAYYAATGKPFTVFDATDPHMVQIMLTQMGGNVLDDQGNFDLESQALKQVLTYQQNAIQEGWAIPTPGGNAHAEEFYGFMNDGGCAALIMPIWYMGRFTNYMPNLDGKIQLTLLPVWEEGGMRTGVSGGTGTAVTNQAEDPQLCKELVAECLLSYEGNVGFWTGLAFDPPRKDVWTDEALKADSVFTRYFLTKDLFGEILCEVENVPKPNVYPNFPAAQTALNTIILPEVLDFGGDIDQVLAAAQVELVAAQ